MSLNAAAMEYLASKGLTLAEVIEFAKLSERKVDRTAAERQARHRAKGGGKKRNAVMSRRDPPIERIHTPTEISPNGETQPSARVRDADWIEIPDWVPAKPWNAFLEMRRRKGKWPSPDAVELMIGKLDRWRAQGHDPTAILNTSTEENWTGIFEPKAPRNVLPASNDHHQNPYVLAVARRETDRAGAEFG